MPLGSVAQWLRAHVPRKARDALYAGKRIVAGNKVSAEYEKKSRRVWRPNVVARSLFSQALGRAVRLKLTTHAMRQIDRSGGLDRWLMKTPDRALHSDVGSALKFQIGLARQRPDYREAEARRYAGAAAALSALRAAEAGAAAAAAALRQRAALPSPASAGAGGSGGGSSGSGSGGSEARSI